MVFTLLVSLPFCSLAQLRYDSATRLGEVVVEQSRLGNYAIGAYTLKVDSLTLQLASASSLADLMRKNGYGHLRAYGPGGLATASFRGTGSSHTAVLWNGINLLSPLSGQLDLSHVPVSFIDDVTVQTGGAASLYGNGSIGATIQLNNQARFNEGLQFTTYASTGSFGTLYQNLGAGWSGKKFITSTKAFISRADNDFPYTNTSTFPARRETRKHTAIDQKGILHQDYWQVAPNHLLAFKLWLQDNSYEVPNPTSVPGPVVAVETNRFYRSLLGWHFNVLGADLSYQAAFIRHELGYTDSLARPTIDSKSTFNTVMQTLEANMALAASATMTTGVNYTWEEGIVDEFGSGTPRRSRIALFTALKWLPFTKWEVAAALREELVSGSTTPLAPTLTIKLRATPALEVYARGSRNYRIPTFNDLYWKGAGALGNPDLRPEISLGQEAGLQYTSPPSASGSRSINFKAAVFSTSVKDWVLWNQVSATTWSPHNVKKVWSRGAEAQASTKTQLGSVMTELSLQYTYTRSTNEDIYDSQTSNELNKQLPLTPMHEGSATGRAGWRNYIINAMAAYTGKQYTDGDNNKFNALKGYLITNVWLSRTFAWKDLRASLAGEVNNVFDVAYQSRVGYPLPGRNYKLSLTLQFNKHKPS